MGARSVSFAVAVLAGAADTRCEVPQQQSGPADRVGLGGLAFRERRYVDHWAFAADEPRTLESPSFDVWVTGPVASGIALEADGGFVVGMSWHSVLASPGLQTNPSGCSGPYLDFITERIERGDGVVSDRRVAVDFGPDEEAATLARITAPTPVYEDGCV